MKNKIDEILSECSDFTTLLRSLPKNSLFVRGVNNDKIEIEKILTNNNERIPRHVPLKIHNYINDYHFEKFGWKIRNGVFTFGIDFSDKPNFNLGYGTDYIFFASNNFKCVFDERIFDLCEFIIDNNIYDLDNNILNDLYTSNDIYKEFSSFLENEKRTVEIIFNCSHYYLINNEYANELILKIWG